MGLFIHNELCLGCGLCDNVVNNEEIMRLMGSGIMTIVDPDKLDKFTENKVVKRRLIRSCPFNAIQEIEGQTKGVPVPAIQHNSIEKKEAEVPVGVI